LLKADQTFLSSLIKSILQQDDEVAFATLFKLFYPKLVDFSVRIVHSKEHGEEIVSDVFVTIWQNRKSIEKINHVQAYLYSSVRNSSLNFIKARHLHTEGLPETHDTDIRYFAHQSFDPEKELELQELQVQMRSAIESLPLQCKAVFKLIKEDGLKYKEVADVLHISTRTVETQLVRALKRLESVMSPYIEKKKSVRTIPLMRMAKSALFSFF
jgi:RNA polymerase sigma-70 factor (family 1)